MCDVSARRSVSPHTIADVSDVAEGVDMGQGGGEHEEALFDRMMQPFDQDIEEKGEEKEHEENATEAINPRVIRAPLKPTAQEVEAHMTTHLPYSS